jgi:hypothetical protein
MHAKNKKKSAKSGDYLFLFQKICAIIDKREYPLLGGR